MSKERRIEIEFVFNTDFENKIEDFLKKADMLFPSAKIGTVKTGIITTTNKLPLPEYKELIAKAFKDNGGQLLSAKEEV